MRALGRLANDGTGKLAFIACLNIEQDKTALNYLRLEVFNPEERMHEFPIEPERVAVFIMQVAPGRPGDDFFE